jgi:predicted kinase
MIKLKDLLEASITGQTPSSDSYRGYKGFLKPEDYEAYKKDLVKKLKLLLAEGIQDKGILKAVFLAGGPGSGKTYVVKQIFGIPDKFNISMSGMKMVNSDKELKHLLRKYGFGTDLDILPDELFKQLTDPDYEDYSGLRGYAKGLTKEREKLYREGRLGMIIDGTGHKFQKIQSHKKELEDIGYDTYMIFVNTSLEVAQHRNTLRDRVLPPDLLEKSWKDVQKNIGSFQALFKNNFTIVDNSKHLSTEEAEAKFVPLVTKIVRKFVGKPIKNKLGKKWVEKQKLLKRRK